MSEARTALYELHRSLDARMVTFAGYSLPVSYPAGIIKEHVHARTRASLFDVSHMGQILVSGREAAARLEALMPADVVGLEQGRQRYALLTNDTGGVLDDLVVSRLDDGFLLVVNAARRAHDLAHLESHLGGDCAVRMLGGRALLALQGPAAADVIARHAPEAAALGFMDATPLTLSGADCIVSRSGYTGEDGFEISVPAREAEALARALLDHPDVAAAGLGARDTLRLEAGLCLYGNDLDVTTTPIEAGLAWALAPPRRPGGARPGGYPGAAAIERQLRDGPPRRRVGLAPDSRVPVRAGCDLADPEGHPVGRVTSGGFGPTLGVPVAMGYVDAAHAAAGTKLAALVRGARIAVRVAPLPFVPHRYKKKAMQGR